MRPPPTRPTKTPLPTQVIPSFPAENRLAPPPPAGSPAGASSWALILERIGWPTAVVVLDWETYFDKTYRLGRGHLSTIEYIEDSRFEVLGVASLFVGLEGDTSHGGADCRREKSVWPLQEESSGINFRKGQPQQADARRPSVLVPGLPSRDSPEPSPNGWGNGPPAPSSEVRPLLRRLLSNVGLPTESVCDLWGDKPPNKGEWSSIPAPHRPLPRNRQSPGASLFSLQQSSGDAGEQSKVAASSPIFGSHFIPGSQVVAFLDGLRSIFGPNLEGITVCCFNARFDGMILARKYGIFPPHVVDPMDLASHLDARAKHNLASLCKQYKLKDKGDTSQFSGLHRADLKADPVKALALAEYACNDAEREFELFELLLPRVTRPEVELPLAAHTLKMFWQPRLALDFNAADRLAVDMTKELDTQVQASGYTAKELSGTNSFVALLNQALPDGEQVPTKVGKKGMIPAFAKNDEAMKALLVHRDPQVRALVKARQAVKSYPLHLKRISSLKAQARAAGGLLCVPLKYYAAHTGRWGGGESINLQNLSKRGTSIAKRIRGLIVAQEGDVLVVVDAGQIETRITFWLAGQEDGLDAFANGRDIYSEFISEVLAQPCRKPRKTDPPTVARVLTARRAQGKTAVLGLGYGMGATRFLEYQGEIPELAPLIASGEIDLLSCRDVVDKYRTRYAMVPRLWRTLERAFLNAANYGTPSLGVLQVTRQDYSTTVQITLPSGRRLFYPNARMVINQDGNEELRYKYGHLWGGILTENCLAGHTPVLTSNGIKPLASVSRSDRVWDGETWVLHSGLVYRGVQEVIGRDGLDMTFDHRCLTTEGWKDAKETAGLTWAEVRSPDSRILGGVRRKESTLVRRVRMREHSDNSILQFNLSHLRHESLPLLCQEETESKPPAICRVDRDEDSMFQSSPTLLQELRRKRDHSLQAMDELRPLFLRYGSDLSAGANLGPHRQSWQLRTHQLSMGNTQGTGTEQTGAETADRFPEHSPARGGGATGHIQQTLPRATTTAVFDLLDCGPYRRFSVLDPKGVLRLVHNCVQAIARDILAEALLRCEARGVPIALHVHDEPVGVVPVDRGQECLQIILDEMKRRPAWAPDLPLDAEGELVTRYGKE